MTLVQYKLESTSGTVSIANTQENKDLLGGASVISLSGGAINLTPTGLECTTNATGQFTMVRLPFLAPNDVVAISHRFTYTATPTATLGLLQLMSSDNGYTAQLRVSTANAPAPRDNGTGGTALTLASGTVPTLVPGTDYVGRWLVSRTAGTATYKLYDATETTLYATWTKSAAVLGSTPFAAVEVGNILGNQAGTIKSRRVQLDDGRTTDIPAWVDPVVEPQGTVIGTLSTTHRTDATDVATSADKGGWTIAQNGAGNAWTFLDAARHGGVSGQRLVQSGSGQPVSNGFADFTNTDPLFGLRWHINFNQTPLVAGTFIRLFGDSTHTTATSLSLSRGTDNKVSIIEAGTTTLGTTSAAVPNATDLILMLLQNGSTGAVMFRAYARGTAAVLIPELAVTMAAPFTVQSVRGGISTPNSLIQLDLNDMCAWGKSGWLPRPDLATLTLDPPPASNGAAVATSTITATVNHGETGAKSITIQNGSTTIAGPQSGSVFTLTPPLVGSLQAYVQPAT